MTGIRDGVRHADALRRELEAIGVGERIHVRAVTIGSNTVNLLLWVSTESWVALEGEVRPADPPQGRTP
jgi:hypothetical protein